MGMPSTEDYTKEVEKPKQEVKQDEVKTTESTEKTEKKEEVANGK